MSSQSLPEKCIETLMIIKEVEQLMSRHKINDFGEVTNFCEDDAQIINDFHAALGSIRSRSARLRDRIRRHVNKLAEPIK